MSDTYNDGMERIRQGENLMEAAKRDKAHPREVGFDDLPQALQVVAYKRALDRADATIQRVRALIEKWRIETSDRGGGDYQDGWENAEVACAAELEAILSGGQG